MEQVFGRFDEPVASINRYIHAAMYEKAKEEGVRVFLDGIDGDTTVSHGYQRLFELGHQGRLWSLLRESKALASRRGLPFSARKTIYGYAVKPRIPAGILKGIRHWRGKKSLDENIALRLNEKFHNMDTWANREREILGYSPENYGDTYQKHAQGFSHPLYPYTMELIDLDSASHGLEARYPFWDRRLMTFCLALPSDQKLSMGFTRAVLHRSMKGILPDVVQQRVSKSNLSPNTALKVSRISPDVVKDLLFSAASPINALIDVSQVRRQWDAFVRRPFENTQLFPYLYTLITLSQWLEHSGLVPGEK
jgi:asparagine synthase (glutamine-hydrolysing)